MATTVYFAPYVRGPEPTPKAAKTIYVTGWKGWFRTLGQSLTDLAPHRQLEQSGMLLVVEIVLCATLLGTATAWLLGPTVQVLGVMLSIDALLLVWLVVGSVVQNVMNSRKQPTTAVPAIAPTRWAYRVANYQAASSVVEPCTIASPSASDGEFRNGLELEAIRAADLNAGDLIIVEAGQTVLADGTILDGTAVVDESAVTGQSEPAVRSADGVATVLRDSRVVAGQILVEVVPRRGHPLDWVEYPDSLLGPWAGGAGRAHSQRFAKV